jgi:hypothetical protein
MKRVFASPHPHFHAGQMGSGQPEGLTERLFPVAFTPATRLRRATSPFASSTKLGTKFLNAQGVPE